MNIARKNKTDSFHESKPMFTDQEQQVLVNINLGISDAWSIHKRTGMLITSVRRCLTDMAQRGEICENGTVYNEETKRYVTKYKINQNQFKLF